MTRDQREKHIKKVASTRLSTGSDKSLRVSSLDPPFGNASQLSLSAEQFHSGLKIPLALFKVFGKKRKSFFVNQMPFLLHLDVTAKVEWLVVAVGNGLTL